MRVIFIACFLLWTTNAWGQHWENGRITQNAWVNSGGYHVEINGIRFIFMRESKIEIDSIQYEVPDRLLYLTTKSKVRFKRDGFRIYHLILEWRNLK